MKNDIISILYSNLISKSCLYFFYVKGKLSISNALMNVYISKLPKHSISMWVIKDDVTMHAVVMSTEKIDTLDKCSINKLNITKSRRTVQNI